MCSTASWSAKKDERVDGPDDADVVVTVGLVDAAADDFDPTVAYMRGVLKASGHTGIVLDQLKSGAAATAIAALVAATLTLRSRGQPIERMASRRSR